MIEQLHLLRRRLDALAVHDQLERVEVDDQLVEHEAARLLLVAVARRAAEHRLDPRKHLFHLEGLRDVIVRALLQAGDLIGRLALGRQHDDGRLAVLPDGAEHAPAVHTRHHHVQQHQIGPQLAIEVDALCAVGGDRRLIALFFQIQPQQICDIIVVLDDEDAFRHFKTPLLRRSRHCFSLFYHTQKRVHELFVKNRVCCAKQRKSVCQPAANMI